MKFYARLQIAALAGALFAAPAFAARSGQDTEAAGQSAAPAHENGIPAALIERHALAVHGPLEVLARLRPLSGSVDVPRTPRLRVALGASPVLR